MWARNLLFVSLCLSGMAALAAGLFRSDRIEQPADFDSGRYADDRYRGVIQRLNEEFRLSWRDRGFDTAARADDLTIMRRLALGLMGTIPSLEEIRAVEVLPDDQRIEWWLSRVLEDRRYADYVAERLARAFVGTEDGPFLVYRRRRFVNWLSDRLYENIPYDEVVRQLISDTGIWTDSPAVNFVTVTLDQNNDNQPDPIRLAGRTTRAFLGMRIDCLQCHDDALGTIGLGSPDEPREGLQSDFHRLAAFYSEATSSLLGISDGDGVYRYKYLHADEDQLIEPVPPFLSELFEQEGTRREQLAHWITHPENRPFARAIVNRMWALMFGKPLVEPIDDIPLYEGFPPGLDALAEDLIQHNYDLRRLIRLIAGTDVFQWDSRAEFEVTTQHEANWAVFPLTRLRPDQVAGSIIQAASLKTIDANSHIIAQLQRFGQQNDFVRRYGDTGEDEFDVRSGTITQRLLMMNGELVRERTKEDLVTNAATRIAMLAPTNQKAIVTVYLAVLGRRPSARELEHFSKRMSEPDVETEKIVEDLYWVLINSTEFSWNH